VEKRPPRKTTIGWTEYIDLLDWDIDDVKAKVDTGARTSALHVENLRETEPGWVEFYVVLTTKGTRLRRRVHAEVVKWARVGGLQAALLCPYEHQDRPCRQGN
jgi:hypothetical protein